jgi:Tol biopolymer transport system component
VFAPGVISGPAHDAAPAFTPDGRTVYFSRNNSAASTILVSRRRAEGWSRPALAPFSGQWNDMEPALAPDGSFLVFVSSRPIRAGGASLDGFYNGQVHKGVGGNLWRVDRRGAGWGDPVRLPDTINRSSSVFAPSVVRDGSVYFMEASKETGKFRLYRSQLKAGTYQTPEPLPFSADPQWTDVDPAVAPDESYAVFASSRPPTAPKNIDLFIVRKQDGHWGVPVHLGTEVNSASSDAEARLSPDGRTLYFSSDRVVPVAFPRTPEAARRDLDRLEAWDNTLYNIWQVDLSPWLGSPGER